MGSGQESVQHYVIFSIKNQLLCFFSLESTARAPKPLDYSVPVPYSLLEKEGLRRPSRLADKES